MKRGIIFGVIAILVLIIAVFGIAIAVGYNNLVQADVDVSEYYAEVENRLQERHDKIGEIVQAVNGLQEHAETVYQMITEARAAYFDAYAQNDMEGLIAADALESIALTQLLAVVEDNPLISATSGYLGLIAEISGMESALARARRDYNAAVGDYNASVRKFPRVLIANWFGFEKEYEYWKINDGADEVPDVVFTD